MAKGEYVNKKRSEGSLLLVLLLVFLFTAAGCLLFIFAPPAAEPGLLSSLIGSFVLFGGVHLCLPWNRNYYISLAPVIFYGSFFAAGPAAAFFVMAVSSIVLSIWFHRKSFALLGLIRMNIMLSLSTILVTVFQHYSRSLSFDNPSTLIITAFHLILTTTICLVCVKFFSVSLKDGSFRPSLVVHRESPTALRLVASPEGLLSGENRPSSEG
ncbi:hypothetical protein [Salibacterium qingdaonense]|uniref:Uncharacterized protein n=1 Tax=Salibacterium qingdaonense TaxID=266892 RepID=A0A1I4P083_9BACI|nr:hypothetical protein [Salibacterium qingdaonense]SFM20947.1 hypothetical protein SAMN04488054_1222 [Salibacterium qingdaonense]